MLILNILRNLEFKKSKEATRESYIYNLTKVDI